ncbi:hemolysin family protein [soil metagenome]
MLEPEKIFTKVFFVFTFVFINALFVLIEFALVRIRMSELDLLVSKGNAAAKLTRNMIDNLNDYISAAQLGITIVNLLLGFIGEDIFVEIFHPFFSMLQLGDSFAHTASVIFGILVITFLTVSIGEIAPKTLAIRFPLKISLFLAIPLKIFFNIFKPFIFLLNKFSELFLRVIGIKSVPKDEMMHSEDEIRYIIAEGKKSGVIDSTEHQLIEKIFDFNDKIAREIMVPRNNMIALNINQSRDYIIQKVIDEGFSRIPVYKDSTDNIIGVIYSKDLISAAEHKAVIALQDILRPVHFIPETKHIGEVLKDLQRKRIHLAIVVNEHGGVEGLLTLEDIIEEIVGEIEDEYDIETNSVQRGKKGVFLVNPEMEIKEFNKRFKAEIPVDVDDYQTLSGFLQTVTGHIPEIYERIDYKDITMTVMKKSQNKLLQIKIQKNTI